MKAIGIDIGTTGISGVLLDGESGALLRAITKTANAFLESAAFYERIQSVDKILSVADGILEELLEDGVGVIGVTGQMHGIVYLDEKGSAVSPLYTWQDGRGDLPYKDTTYAVYLGCATGYGNVTDFYNRENGIRPASAVTYATVHDYYVMHLCGLCEPLLHDSDAASLGLYNLQTKSFDYDYHPVVKSGFCLAGKHKGIPVTVAIGDNQASVLSTAKEGDILVNVGTGSQVSLISSIPANAEGIESRPFFEGKHLLVGSALCGGRAFSVLKDFYSRLLSYFAPVDDGEIYAAMKKMYDSARGGTLTVDTRFAGTRTDRTVRGKIENISSDNFTPEELTLGTLRGMAKELYGLYEKMGTRGGALIGSGNGIRKNAPLVAACEEMFGFKMKTPTHLEEAAFGAALYGLLSVGAYPTLAAAQELIRYEQ